MITDYSTPGHRCTATATDKAKGNSNERTPQKGLISGNAEGSEGEEIILASAISVHAKGHYVRGVVEFVDESHATILLESGEWGKLQWANFTKSSSFSPKQVETFPLAVGDKIWANVLRVPTVKESTDAKVMLSTAALEVCVNQIIWNT